jgi:hypothetical protein
MLYMMYFPTFLFNEPYGQAYKEKGKNITGNDLSILTNKRHKKLEALHQLG